MRAPQAQPEGTCMTSTDDAPADDTSHDTSRALPVVRLKPKAEARAIRHGFPWVYADELVTDRRTQSLAPGALGCWKMASGGHLALSPST